MTPVLSGLDHLVLTVRSIAATSAFYRDVLGMEVRAFQPADGSTRTALYFGAQKINLHEVGAEFKPHAMGPTAGSADLCFLSDTVLEDWMAHLSAAGVEIEEGPIDRSGAQFAIRSIYIRDPDGNLIEISNSTE
ncbi:MAG: VOC family protein [Litoreibacter sp.]|uniref:VOC family protein n=1 Tax=Litoreibacter sp. TaxID=1969459 RepID=UPI003297F2DF